MAGRGAAIKERNIAVDVFERNSDFDAHSASIVRVTGGEVRKRLAQAYASGLDHGVRVELPLGSYQPTFHFEPDLIVEPELPEAEETTAPAPRSIARPQMLIAAAVAVLIVLVGIAMAYRLDHPPSQTDRLWQPFLNPDKPVLVSLATLTTPNDKSSEDPTKETSFVGTGGALGAARFAEQLALRRQSFQLKFGSDVSFSDLKSSAAILLGSTRWSDELMRTQRFRIEREGNQPRAIIDSEGAGHRWSAIREPGGSEITEGYSLVTRLLNTETGRPILLLAGLDPRDTQAAVEFLADDHLFEIFTATAPSDWTRKNFQIVLHNRIFGKSPGSLNVVASKVW